jgi:hypothetical protein
MLWISWVQTTLEGYIIEFVAENHQSFSKKKSYSKKELEEDCCWEISLWINILLVEEGMFHVPFTNMVV